MDWVNESFTPFYVIIETDLSDFFLIAGKSVFRCSMDVSANLRPRNFHLGAKAD